MDGFGIGDIPPHRMPRVLDILRVVSLQHLGTVMVDDLDSDLASLRRVEGAAGGGIKRVAITIGVLPTVGSSIVGEKPTVRRTLPGATSFNVRSVPWHSNNPAAISKTLERLGYAACYFTTRTEQGEVLVRFCEAPPQIRPNTRL